MRVPPPGVDRPLFVPHAEPSGPALGFSLPGGAHALFTTREHGNLSTLRGTAPERGDVRREAERGDVRREELRARLGLRWLCASRQAHGATVRRVATADGRGGEPLALAETGVHAAGACPPASVADGHATALRGVGVMVLAADCLPVILAGDGAVAALHAGWRGLAAGVLEEGVAAVRELGAGGELTALVGPGARGCCYEVGEEVHAVFGGANQPHLHPHRRGRKLDLAAIAEQRLRAAGVARVEDVGVCTICDPRFFSHRREGAGAGRQAGIAWLS